LPRQARAHTHRENSQKRCVFFAVRPDGTQEGHKLNIHRCVERVPYMQLPGKGVTFVRDKEDPGEKRNEKCVSFSSAKQLPGNSTVLLPRQARDGCCEDMAH
jgi:hypothetical protein